VRIGTEGAYPPFNFINDANELDGFEIELGNELCKRAGLTCEWVINDWDTIIPNLVGGNYDTIMAGMNATEARAQGDLVHARLQAARPLGLYGAGRHRRRRDRRA
jgi:polar amino acid transport system substrate-binding protein